MNTFINRNMLSISLIFIIISIYMNSLNAISNINDNNTTNVTISSGSVSTKSLKKDCTNMSKEEVNENAYRLAIGILIAIIYGLFQATILDPNQMEKATEFALNQAIDQNPEMTDEMITMTKEWIEWGTSPTISTAFAFGFGLIFGGIVSLITGLIVKKSRPNQ